MAGGVVRAGSPSFLEAATAAEHAGHYDAAERPWDCDCRACATVRAWLGRQCQTGAMLLRSLGMAPPITPPKHPGVYDLEEGHASMARRARQRWIHENP